MNLDFYSVPTETGEKAFRYFSGIARQAGFAVREIDASSANQLTFMKSCVGCEVVFVDATIPDDPRTPSVYPCLLPAVNSLDRVFVYSGSRLPLNVVPGNNGALRDNGKFRSEGCVANGWARFDVNEKSDPNLTRESDADKCLESAGQVFEDYLSWILEEVRQGRLCCEKKDFGRDFRSLCKCFLDLQSESTERAARRKGSSPLKADDRRRIFISYRERINGKHSQYADVVDFAAEKAGEGFLVDYVRKEELSAQQELMSPMRKWFVLSQLADRIICADEFWIYQSDNYLASWWTIGELLLVSYLNQGYSRRERPIRIMVYDPRTKRVEEASDNYYVHDEMLFKRLARYLSYSDPNQMGPESRKVLKRQRAFYRVAKWLPILLQIPKWMVRWQLKMLNGLGESKLDDLKGDLEEEVSSAGKMLDRLADDVNQDAFWEGLTLQLTDSTKALRDGGKCNLSAENLSDAIDFNMFLKSPMLELVENDASTMEAKLPPEGKSFLLSNSILRQEGQPAVRKRVVRAQKRYLWLATRWMRPIQGSFGPGLDFIQTYSVKDASCHGADTSPSHA